MKVRNILLSSIALSFCLFSAVAHAQSLDTVDWAPGISGSGTGTGTLSGGTIIVTYISIPGGNSGNTIADDWTASLATAAAVPGGVTHKTGGVYATAAALSPVTQTITFSAPVTNPIFLANFTDAPTTYDFGTLSLTLLSSNNANLTGSIVTFPGAGGDFNSGFAARIKGAFGPGNPLQFQDSTPQPFNPDGFTIGLASVPEPGTLALFTGLSVPGMLVLKRRRRK